MINKTNVGNLFLIEVVAKQRYLDLLLESDLLIENWRPCWNKCDIVKENDRIWLVKYKIVGIKC